MNRKKGQWERVGKCQTNKKRLHYLVEDNDRRRQTNLLGKGTHNLGTTTILYFYSSLHWAFHVSFAHIISNLMVILILYNHSYRHFSQSKGLMCATLTFAPASLCCLPKLLVFYFNKKMEMLYYSIRWHWTSKWSCRKKEMWFRALLINVHTVWNRVNNFCSWWGGARASPATFYLPQVT